MAFTIPIAIGAGIAVGGTGLAVGGTALGLAISVSNRMKHKHMTSITNTMNLSVGDHISLKNKGALPFSHAIVVEKVKAREDKVKVVYHTGSKTNARVEFTEADLCKQAVNQELDRHPYEGLVCYQAEEVADRAKSLCPHYISPDKSEVVSIYWPFFRDDEHFANWCQIGFCFSDGMKAAMAADYTKTKVSDLATLSEGSRSSTTFQFHLLPRCLECRRGLAMRILSVCPSVRPPVRPSVKRVNCD